MGIRRWGACAAWAVAALSVGFGGCSNCEEGVEEMRHFLLAEANQVCATDADCVVAGTGCAELDEAFCGQVSMNRAAAQSDTWQRLVDEASCESSCAQCGALLIATCSSGRCFQPR